MPLGFHVGTTFLLSKISCQWTKFIYIDTQCVIWEPGLTYCWSKTWVNMVSKGHFRHLRLHKVVTCEPKPKFLFKINVLSSEFAELGSLLAKHPSSYSYKIFVYVATLKIEKNNEKTWMYRLFWRFLCFPSHWIEVSCKENMTFWHKNMTYVLFRLHFSIWFISLFCSGLN